MVNNINSANQTQRGPEHNTPESYELQQLPETNRTVPPARTPHKKRGLFTARVCLAILTVGFSELTILGLRAWRSRQTRTNPLVSRRNIQMKNINLINKEMNNKTQSSFPGVQENAARMATTRLAWADPGYIPNTQALLQKALKRLLGDVYYEDCVLTHARFEELLTNKVVQLGKEETLSLALQTELTRKGITNMNVEELLAKHATLVLQVSTCDINDLETTKQNVLQAICSNEGIH